MRIKVNKAVSGYQSRQAITFFALDHPILEEDAGHLPCADCDGIKTKLSLFGNNTYELYSLYINKGNPYTEKGTWQEIEKNHMHMYALKSKNNFMSYYHIVDSNTIKMLDSQGKIIKSPFKMTLTKE